MAAYLLDTNVLLRLVKPDDYDYELVRSVVRRLSIRGDDLFYTSQNLAEFWNTCTRPGNRNGFGLTTVEVDRRARLIETQFNLLPEEIAVHLEWRKLLVDHAVSGVQVHDARLVAAMRVHHVPYILTFNSRDFARYTGIQAIPPGDLASSR